MQPPSSREQTLFQHTTKLAAGRFDARLISDEFVPTGRAAH
jgi:hypothetical protein